MVGSRLTENYIQLAGNNVEANQSKAVVVVFDNVNKQVDRIPGSYVNTQPSAPFIISDTIEMQIGFRNPVEISTLGTPPFNPFIIKDGVRGAEIHLHNFEPTDLADVSLFGTGHDASNPAMGIFYSSQNHLPWGLNFPGQYDYTIEKSRINQGHLKFIEWCQSGGALYPDWYLPLAGYRDLNHIY